MLENTIGGFVQWRIKRLQVFNWGTFSNIHDIPISEKGFLFVGASGSGKSTLLDAMITLLFPNPAYNAAAREGEQRRGDRNLLTYIRGAWSTQAELEGTGSPRAKTQYLRPGATFSAAALTLFDTESRTGDTTLLLVACIRKSSNEEAAVNKQFFIIDGSYSFNADDFTGFAKSQFDWRWLKERLPPFTSFTTFNAYSDAFCDRFGIREKTALKLLAKAQSAKNLGDLNTFLRNFMLEEPRTFAMADKLTTEFHDLSDAHSAVVEAREQRDILREAKKLWDESKALERRIAFLESEKNAMQWWRPMTEKRLEEAELPKLQRELEKAMRTLQIAVQKENEGQTKADELRTRLNESGGFSVQQLEARVRQLTTECARAEAHKKSALRHASTLQKDLPKSSDAWLNFIDALHLYLEEEDRAGTARTHERDGLVSEERDRSKVFQDTVQEINSMRERPSNIPSKNLDLRAELAADLNVSEEELPFVGELIQVKPDESRWQGAIERVLHNFALSILVDEKLYPAFTEFFETKRLRGRIVYYRVRNQVRDFDGFFRPRSIPSKLDFKVGRWDAWLAAECAQRFSYLCAENLDEFRRADQAVTRAGQVKHNAERHEKDDRIDVDDRRRWVTGFSNQEKLALFEKEARRLGAEITALQQRIRKIETEAKAAQQRISAANALLNTDWDEIDADSAAERLQAANDELDEFVKKTPDLERLKVELRDAETQLAKLREARSKASADESIARSKNKAAEERISAHADALSRLERMVKDGNAKTPGKDELDSIDRRATDNGKIELTLKNLNARDSKVKDQIADDQLECTNRKTAAEGGVTSRFDNFLFRWPKEKESLDSKIEFAPDFFKKLDRIETDGLPRHEKRFRELLETQSLQHFADLNLEMRQARQDILQRMETVNESLAAAPFSRLAEGDSHLRIEVKDLKIKEVEDFRRQVGELIQGAWEGELTDDDAEKRYKLISELVRKLDPAQTTEKPDELWRLTVLDVRRHVAFTASELNDEGEILETYFSGSGKSGGQRQKLTTTCLAAALRYQLGSIDNGLPAFAPVILDEAFDKADSEFTDISMNIFNRFGFQMIVATPEKSVVTLEPYIGGAFYVVMEDRRNSSGLSVSYDDKTGRLDFRNAAPVVPQKYEVKRTALKALKAAPKAASSEEKEEAKPEPLPGLF